MLEELSFKLGDGDMKGERESKAGDTKLTSGSCGTERVRSIKLTDYKIKM